LLLLHLAAPSNTMIALALAMEMLLQRIRACTQRSGGFHTQDQTKTSARFTLLKQACQPNRRPPMA
jgi:hypothetical protein